jgi:spermidine/putrescine transport system ATP-binding protein
VFELDSKARPGEQVSFVVAADVVSLSTARPATRNVFSGQLISEEFVGSMVTLFFETADGMEVKLQMQERLLEGIPREPGQQLFLSFDPSHAHVLKG